jgi:hypothetical protein
LRALFNITLPSCPRRLRRWPAFGRTTRRRHDDNDETRDLFDGFRPLAATALRAVAGRWPAGCQLTDR